MVFHLAMALFKKEPVPSQSPSAPAGSQPAPAKPSPPPVAFVTYAGDPLLVRLRSELAAGNWKAAVEHIETCRSVEDQIYVIGGLAAAETLPADWVEQAGGSAMAYTLRGAHMVGLAWRERGSGRATSVTDDGWRGFQKYLDLAYTDLQEAIAKDPASPLPWSFMIQVAMGLGLPKAEILRLVQEADARHRGLTSVYKSAVLALAQKWGGSHQLTLDFAREAHATLPAGTGALSCMADAHIWIFEYLKKFEEPSRDKEYFRGKDVGTELISAAERSVLHPDAPLDCYSPSRWNGFAFCLSFVADEFPTCLGAAKTLYDWLGNNFPSSPWLEIYGAKAGPMVCARVRRSVLSRLEVRETQAAGAS